MDQTVFLSIVGIAITVVLGVWSIYLATRYRYPARITFVKDLSLGLVKSLTKNLPELSIQYKGAPVAGNVLFFSGYFLNDGQKDINPGMIEQPLCVDLPEGFKWLAANISTASPNVKATVEIIRENRIEFYLGLFRRGEHFKLEALAEVPAGKRLTKNLVFSHRIADTNKVRRTSFEGLAEKKFLPIKFVAAVVIIFSFFYLPKPSKEGLFKDNGRLVEVEILASDARPQFVDLVGSKESFYKRVAVKDPRLINRPKPLSVRLVAASGLISMFILMILGIVGEEFTRKRMRKRLSQGQLDDIELRKLRVTL
jgi:hypothetical protein